MFEHKNLYPVILVPGVVGYGDETMLHKVFPYFGMTSTSYGKVIKDMGMDCHTATFEILSSVWDRTCELYAQIVGGTVDYGKVHSEKYGHERYGKTYEKPMVENWDKITLIAHGFGAPVARLFMELLANGSQEEKDGTPESELSYLFRGGYGGKVHALVTLTGINDGISVAEAFDTRIKNGKKLLTKFGVILDEALKYVDFVDPYYQAHGMTVSQHKVAAHWCEVDGKKKLVFGEQAIDKYLANDDNVFYDISDWGMEQLNKHLTAFDNVYYFSFSGSVTTNILGKVTIPNLSAGITFPSSLLISTYTNYLPEKPIVTTSNLDNDGFITTNASMPPVNEEAAAFKDVAYCQPGVWYQMPIEKRNHFSYIGLFERPDRYRNEIYDLMKIICNLETI